MNAWFALLDGNISVPVYRVDAPATETGNYVLLRVESFTDSSNNSKFVTEQVIITDVVTKFATMINDSKADEIDEEISGLLYPSSPGHHALPSQADIQIVSVIRRDATVLNEDDGTYRYNRLITRNIHRVEQLN